MRSLITTLGLLAAAVPTILAQATQAPEVTGNPEGAEYIATLPNNSTLPNGNVVIATEPGTDKGVNVLVSIADLPKDGGPYLYQIHVNPVAPNGSCSTVGGILDPYLAGEATQCNPSNPEDCQVGDLSGKHGAMNNGTSFAADYDDKYLSTQPGTPAFVGNRSLVIDYANKTIITCANFTLPGQSSAGSGSSAPAASVASIASTSTILSVVTVSVSSSPTNAAASTVPISTDKGSTVLVAGSQTPKIEI